MNKYTIKFTECKEIDGILGKLAELEQLRCISEKKTKWNIVLFLI